jgi:hypothetical protein
VNEDLDINGQDEIERIRMAMAKEKVKADKFIEK